MLSKENEAKVFILYLMNYADCGLDYDNILNIAEECGFGYFDFAEIFGKLLQENNVRKHEEKDEETGDSARPSYFITERGVTIAENLEHLVPVAAKNKCVAYVSRLLELNGGDFYSEIEPENGGYRLTFGIKNKHGVLFNAMLFIKEKSGAENMQKRFNERPDYIYRCILGVMTGDVNFVI